MGNPQSDALRYYVWTHLGVDRMTSQEAFEKAYPMPAGVTRMGDAYRYAATANIHTRIDQEIHADSWKVWQRAFEFMGDKV